MSGANPAYLYGYAIARFSNNANIQQGILFNTIRLTEIEPMIIALDTYHNHEGDRTWFFRTNTEIKQKFIEFVDLQKSLYGIEYRLVEVCIQERSQVLVTA